MAEISIGEHLPPVNIESQGELVLNGSTIDYQPWHSSVFSTAQPPRVHVVQYLAARMAASKINEPFTDRLGEIKFPIDKHLVTTIINTSDAMWGTSGFVLAELESNKEKHPHASMVADQHGVGAKTWSLSLKNSAIIVLSPCGKVLFFHQGALSAEQLSDVIALIEQQIQQLDSTLASSDG